MSRMPETPEEVVKQGLCVGCGFCAVGDASVKMKFDERRDMFVPVESDRARKEFVCPGREMNMVGLAERVHGQVPADPMLGTYEALRVCATTDETIRKRAASGGVIPAVLRHLFESDRIDAAYCVDSGHGPYGAQGRLVRTVEELGRIQGSVYHPVDFGAELDRLVSGTERFAFVGLPCQVAGLEMLKRQRPELAARHVLTIGLFCGGINTFQGIAYYLRGFKVAWPEVTSIRYRHGDWPGKILLRLRSGAERIIPRIRGNSRWKILRYVVGFQGYWMLKRCRLCPDQVNDFADIAVGDPHLPEFRQQGGPGSSVVVSRTKRAEAILKEMLSRRELDERPISRDAVVESQGYCLDNRRHMTVYNRVVRFFGGATPGVVVYPALKKSQSLRHWVYATVDMMKVALPKHRLIALFYVPWQIFEYLFITMTPTLIWSRFFKLLRNR